MTTYYKYGMRLRGVAPGAQPMKGLVCTGDDYYFGKYHSIIVYSRQLTAQECNDYDLDFIETEELEDYNE